MASKRRLAIVHDIVAGEKTCYSSPGKHCKFLCTRRFSSEYLCGLFNRDDSPYRGIGPILLQEDKPGGWIQRCPECLEAEAKGQLVKTLGASSPKKSRK